MDFDLCEKIEDCEGRILILKVKINTNYYTIGNFYAPTQCHKNDQINFVTKMNNSLTQFEGETLILGGDLNFYMNPILDKKDTMTTRHDNHTYRQNIISLMETHCLTDCFRDLNPTLRRYTWHSRGKASRLDYFLISDYLLNEIVTCKIDPGLHSDHSIFKLAIGNNDIPRGKTFGNLITLFYMTKKMLQSI